MNRKKEIETLKQHFMLKRMHAQEQAEEFISSLRKTPEFDAMYTEYNQKNLDYIKSKFEQENLALKAEVENLKAKIDSYLKTNKIDASRMEPKYECPICNDTGIVNGQMCNCLKKELNEKLSKQFSSQSEFKTFADCDASKMNETDKKTCEILKTWCQKYPNTKKLNINLLGGAGVGKTFLLECVANEMINRNYVVCFKTAFEVNELARLYHIGKSYDFADCLNADILIIDDLGTEPVLKNVTIEYLYNLINTRQVNNLPTFLSSNLSLDNILDRYDERIFSRLANKALSLNIALDSQDKRLK
ncbi:MAG: ATP-binding protein [Clostridia bacterium]|nr:ATP-binding protein [Clostridia bacterium]